MPHAPSRQERQLEQLLQQPGNDICADCKAPAPRWASINLGIFLCVQCASIHRSLGTHTSRVKSVSMDTWTREMVEQMRTVGNVRGNAEWNPDEGRNPVPVSTEGWKDREGEMEKFIRKKYEQGAFRADAAVTVPAPNRTRAEPLRSHTAPSRKASDPYTSNPLLIPTQDFPPSNGDGRQVHTYPMAGPSSSGKRTATRAHVDANWADLMSLGPTSSSGTAGKKAGRLLGMHEADDEQYLGAPSARDRDDGTGGIRLPPVTKAPKGLSYKSDTPIKARPPPPPPPPASVTPRSNGNGNETRITSDKEPQIPPPLINAGTSERTQAQQTPSGIMNDMHTQHHNGPATATGTATGMPGNSFNPFMNRLYTQPQYQQPHQQQQQYQPSQQQPQPQQQQGYPSTVGVGYPGQPSMMGPSMPGMGPGPGPGVAMGIGMGVGMGMGMGVGPGTTTSGMSYPNAYPYPPPNQISPFILPGTTGSTPYSPFAPVQQVGGGMGGAGYFGGQQVVVGQGQTQTQGSEQGQQQGMVNGTMMGWNR